MLSKTFTFIFSCFLLVACDGKDSSSDVQKDLISQANDFAADKGFQALNSLKSTSLSDFNFTNSPEYVEIRFLGESSFPEEFDVYKELDPEVKKGFTESELYNLNSITSSYGYSYGCAPEYCSIYLVSKSDEEVALVNNKQDLNLFLGDVDMPAEIHFLLMQENNPTHFKYEEEGFSVISVWNDCNGSEGINIYGISLHGDVVLQETLVKQATSKVC